MKKRSLERLRFRIWGLRFRVCGLGCAEGVVDCVGFVRALAIGSGPIVI